MQILDENAHRFIGELLAEPSLTHPQDLSDWSTRAAVLELTENWEPALREGAVFSEVIGDVDRVIEKLLAFKARALAQHEEWVKRCQPVDTL